MSASEEITPEAQEHWRQMRAIMYQPTAVWLATDKHGDRWLTDQYVMLKITGSEHFSELPDGPYKIAFISKGPEPREAKIDFKIDDYFASMNEREWLCAEPTLWSVDEGTETDRAMLWETFNDRKRVPALMGRETWKAVHRFYPDVIAEHSWRGNSVFRFSALPVEHQACDWDNYCGHRASVFAYAAGIKMPSGQQVIADAILKNVPEASEAVVQELMADAA